MLPARAGEQHAQVVVNLRDRSDRAPRIPPAGLLLNGDGRTQTGDLVHVGLGQLPEELSGIGTKRFEIATLAFREECVKGKAALSAAGYAGETNQLSPG